MRIVSYGAPRQWKPGIDIGDAVADTAVVLQLAGWPEAERTLVRSNRDLLGFTTARVLALGETARSRRAELAAAGALHALEAVHLGPPVPDPEKIICIGLNYIDHAAEVGAALPDEPMFFAKYANSLIGPADEIAPPSHALKVDYEAELAVVIGRRGRDIAPGDALQHVAGAMAFNDVSARDLQLANQLWTGGKAIDTFAPCGPALVLKEALPDLQALRLSTRIGDRVLQDGTTASMKFGVATIIAFLSRIMTLEPGDIIATGTPAGVAAAHSPPRYLQPGDVVEVEVEGIGTLRNRVRAAPEGADRA